MVVQIIIVVTISFIFIFIAFVIYIKYLSKAKAPLKGDSIDSSIKNNDKDEKDIKLLKQPKYELIKQNKLNERPLLLNPKKLLKKINPPHKNDLVESPSQIEHNSTNSKDKNLIKYENTQQSGFVQKIKGFFKLLFLSKTNAPTNQEEFERAEEEAIEDITTNTKIENNFNQADASANLYRKLQNSLEQVQEIKETNPSLLNTNSPSIPIQESANNQDNVDIYDYDEKTIAFDNDVDNFEEATDDVAPIQIKQDSARVSFQTKSEPKTTITKKYPTKSKMNAKSSSTRKPYAKSSTKRTTDKPTSTTKSYSKSSTKRPFDKSTNTKPYSRTTSRRTTDKLDFNRNSTKATGTRKPYAKSSTKRTTDKPTSTTKSYSKSSTKRPFDKSTNTKPYSRTTTKRTINKGRPKQATTNRKSSKKVF